MGLADYYHRGAVAVSQVLSGFDEDAIKGRLAEVRVGIGFDATSAALPEARFLLDMLVRLTARLYPVLTVNGDGPLSSELVALAQAINPAIEIEAGGATVGVWVGPHGKSLAPQMFYAGCDGSTALLSTTQIQPVGQSANPFGPGVTACLTAANVFRSVFLQPEVADLDRDVAFVAAPDLPGASLETNLGEVAIAGGGAVGNGAVWALARLPARGQLHLIDPEPIDLGNLQRYVLASRTDVGRTKVAVLATHLSGALEPLPHFVQWAEFVADHGNNLPAVLVALDSARDRSAVQASLPAWVANAWTQPGDLGVSAHRFVGEGACLACLYLPADFSASEDAIYAEALHIPDQLMRVRDLLYHGAGMPIDLLDLIAQRMGRDRQLLLAFEGRDIRALYVEGICGGAVVPLGEAGSPVAQVHVPLAHQSALAGILLAARLVAERSGHAPNSTEVTRIDLMRRLPRWEFLTQPAAKDPRGICICQDADYVAAYESKYPSRHATPNETAPLQDSLSGPGIVKL